MGDATTVGLGPRTSTCSTYSSKEEDNKQNEDTLDKLKGMGEEGEDRVMCRTCAGDHWTRMCPNKDTDLVGGKIPKGGKKEMGTLGPAGMGKDKTKPSVTKPRGRDDFAIRISNLSESTTVGDLEDLVKPFGPIQKRYLAKDKITGFCKGFSYIHFKFKSDAAKAIAQLNGLVYDHLILNVDRMMCRTCAGDHWTAKCPNKDTDLVSGKIPKVGKKEMGTLGPAGMGEDKTKPSVTNPRGRDDFAIRISNLSESTTEGDLEDLVKPFGLIKKRYLAKDKITGFCKGFSYIHFKFKSDAAKAIAQLNGLVYDHLILNVDWSKPPAQSN